MKIRIVIVENTMHILFFTYDIPYPPNSGGKTRAFNLLKYAKHNADVSLFSFNRDGYDLTGLDELKKIGIKAIELFPRRKVRDIRHIRSLISKHHSIFYSLYYDKEIHKSLLSYVKEKHIDLVHFESFYTGFYASEDLRGMSVKQVYGSENIEYKLYEEGLAMTSPFLRPLLKRESTKIKKEEIAMVNAADSTLAVTRKETNYFKSHTKKPVYVIENGVSVENFPEIPGKKHDKLKLLFIGNFTYFPNIDGLRYFMKEVWNYLDTSAYHLTVVGKNVHALPFLNDKIEKIDYIADIYDAYAGSDVFISPMRYGGGTNFKVLEAMAAGLPVVALSQKINEYGFTDGKDVLVANTGKEFMQKLVLLRNDKTLRSSIGKNARTFVFIHFSWDKIGKKLYNIWRGLVNEAN